MIWTAAATSASSADPVSRIVGICALIVAALALSVSAATLYRTHLSRMRLIVAAGPMTIRISAIESDDGENWFIPTLDVRADFANTGARAGQLLGLRLRVAYPSVPIADAHEYFRLHSEVDSALFRKYSASRFQWCDRAVVGNGAPFVVLAKSSVEKHLVFDTRWEKPVQQSLRITLEAAIDANKTWMPVESWEIDIDPFVWHQCATVGTCVTVAPSTNLDDSIGHRVPADLHTHTGLDGPVPEDGVYVGASYLRTPRRSAKSRNL